MKDYIVSFLFLFLFNASLPSNLLLVVEANDVDSLPTNTICNNGPNALSFIGAERTCFERAEGTRCFFTFIPDCAGPDAPLVFDIHGYQSCPWFHRSYSGWLGKARENCFVLVWPLVS